MLFRYKVRNQMEIFNFNTHRLRFKVAADGMVHIEEHTWSSFAPKDATFGYFGHPGHLMLVAQREGLSDCDRVCFDADI